MLYYHGHHTFIRICCPRRKRFFYMSMHICDFTILQYLKYFSTASILLYFNCLRFRWPRRNVAFLITPSIAMNRQRNDICYIVDGRFAILMTTQSDSWPNCQGLYCSTGWVLSNPAIQTGGHEKRITLCSRFSISHTRLISWPNCLFHEKN